MNLGYINYLNCFPFYFNMFEKVSVKNVKIIPGYPGELNKMLMNKELDMSPISSATCADMMDKVLVLPDFCLSSIGYVGSVILATRIPIEDLDKKKIGLSSASHTSVVLLKILLKKYYNIEPEYVPFSPKFELDNTDADLVIGNDAMVRTSEPVSYVYDLGDLWMRKTGFPVVFAVFVIQEDIIDTYHTEIKNIIDSYHLSLKNLEQHRNVVIGKAREKYPDIIYDIDNYYDLLQFRFNSGLKKALEFYFSTAGEMGLIKKVEKIRYYNER